MKMYMYHDVNLMVVKSFFISYSSLLGIGSVVVCTSASETKG